VASRPRPQSRAVIGGCSVGFIVVIYHSGISPLTLRNERTMSQPIEFGLDTFLPVTVDAAGRPVRGDQVIRDAVEEAVLADAVGIDSFNIGEHYRTEFMDSANHVVLAAIAGRTARNRPRTPVTPLSTASPGRLYTNFATLDAVSNGRAQLI